MDISDLFLAFFVCVSLTIFSPNSRAAVVPINNSAVNLLNKTVTSTESQILSVADGVVVSNPRISLTVPSSQGNQIVNLDGSKYKIPSGKLMRSAGTILRSLPAIGTAIAVASVFCDYASICSQPDPLDATKDILMKKSLSGNWVVNQNMNYSGYTAEQACELYVNYLKTTDDRHNYMGVESVGDQFYCLSNPYGPTQRSGGLASQIVPETTYAPANDADWNTAYNALDAVSIPAGYQNIVAKFVAQKNGLLPIDGFIYGTENVNGYHLPNSISSLSDSQGNVNNNVNISDQIDVSSIAGDIANVNVKQTTTTTTTNAQGVITSTSTTVTGEPAPVGTNTTISAVNNPSSLTNGSTSPLPVEPVPPPTVEIDSVADVALDTVAVGSTFAWTSFGNYSTCPPDYVMVTKWKTLQFSFAPLCSFMGGLRYVLLLVAFFTGALIVSGIKYD